MKKLIALCAVLGLGVTATADNHGADIHNSGSFRLQYMNTDNANGFNEDVSGRSHDWQQRFQWNLGVKASEDVQFNAKFVHAADWGSNADQVPGNGNGNSSNQENVLTVNEANATWMISDEMSVRFGRGSADLADGSVVASNEWEQIQKAFDGAMFMYDHEMAKIGLFGVRGAEAAGTAQYGNFAGFSVDFKSLPEVLKMAHLHYITVKRDAGTYSVGALNEEDTTRLGFTVGGDASMVDYRATYAMYSGETGTATTTDVDATMLDAEVGFSMPETMNFRVSVIYHTDSGTPAGSTDNETYSGFHYDTHNNAGVMDQVQWGNLTYQKVGLSLDPMEDVTVGLDYYMFSATEEGDNTLNGALTGATNQLASASTADDIGEELDLWATKRYSDNFSVTGWYAMFTPGDRLGNDLDDRTQLYFAANYNF